jgi:hypothetical protein
MIWMKLFPTDDLPLPIPILCGGWCGTAARSSCSHPCDLESVSYQLRSWNHEYTASHPPGDIEFVVRSCPALWTGGFTCPQWRILALWHLALYLSTTPPLVFVDLTLVGFCGFVRVVEHSIVLTADSGKLGSVEPSIPFKHFYLYQQARQLPYNTAALMLKHSYTCESCKELLLISLRGLGLLRLKWVINRVRFV